MNICLANDSFPPLIDGVANTVVNYAHIIQAQYGRAIVATPYYPGKAPSFSFPVVRYPSLDTRKLVGYRAGYPFGYETIHRLRKFGPDIIHSHCPVASTLLARQLREVTGAPVVFTYHTKFDIDIRNALKGAFIQETAIKYLVDNITACDEVWVVSRGAGENLKSLGYTGDYIIMRNGVDIPRTDLAPPELAELDAEYALPSGIPIFLFVGRIMWYKGLRLLLDGLSLLEKAGFAFRMVFVGDGADKKEVQAYAAQLGLKNHCFFTGPIRDRELLKKWYCRADLFLFPSTFDTNGLVVREAAACGLASVLIQGSCAAEDTRDGEDCILIQETPESLAQALSQLMGHPEQFRKLGEGAAQNLYLSWEDSVQRAVGRYEYLLQHGGTNRQYDAHFDDMIRILGDLYRGIDQFRNFGHRAHASDAK
jgi:1,2-diacylglycerol 3-alpha-glucosyltransferase